MNTQIPMHTMVMMPRRLTMRINDNDDGNYPPGDAATAATRQSRQ